MRWKAICTHFLPNKNEQMGNIKTGWRNKNERLLQAQIRDASKKLNVQNLSTYQIVQQSNQIFLHTTAS